MFFVCLRCYLLVRRHPQLRVSRRCRHWVTWPLQVSSSGECYLKDPEYREEGGTPDSVGIIRLALAVKLKRAMGEAAIAALERQKSE